MPEIKHNFIKGRMNKDLDERLVPNGEYRDALNVEVSTSESSNAGSLQSLKGNIVVSSVDHNSSAFSISDNAVSVASYTDESTKTIFNFISKAQDLDADGVYAGFTRFTGIKSDAITMFVQTGAEEGFVYPLVTDVYESRQTPSIQTSQNGILTGLTSVEQGTSGGVVVYRPLGVRPGMRVRLLGPDGTDLYAGQKIFVTAVGQSTSSTGTTVTTSIPTSSTFYSQNLKDAGFVFQFTAPRILDFQQGPQEIEDNVTNKPVSNTPLNTSITAINYVDDILFYTDNRTEPKRIVVDRFKEPSGDYDTYSSVRRHSVWKGNGTSVYLEEDRITVIRRNPLTPPLVKSSLTSREPEQIFIDGQGYSATYDDTVVSPILQWFSSTSTAEAFRLADISNNPYLGGQIIYIKSSAGKVHWKLGDYIRIVGNTTASLAKIRISQVYSANSDFDIFQAKIVEMPLNYDGTEDQEVWTGSLIEKDSIYEDKFMYFAYRYKYIDGEYSCISPYSRPVFKPNFYSYSAENGFNIGMESATKYISLSDFVRSNYMDPDIESVEILLKNAGSETVQVVREVKKDSDAWNAGGTHANGFISMSSEVFGSSLPSDQLVRPFDAVPRYAKAQEFTGSRLLYGNYTEGYDLKDSSNNIIDPNVSLDIELVPNDFTAIVNGQNTATITNTNTYGFNTTVYDDDNPDDFNEFYPNQQLANNSSVNPGSFKVSFPYHIPSYYSIPSGNTVEERNLCFAYNQMDPDMPNWEGWALCGFNQEQDPGNNFDFSTMSYEISEPGSYTFSTGALWYFTGSKKTGTTQNSERTDGGTCRLVLAKVDPNNPGQPLFKAAYNNAPFTARNSNWNYFDAMHILARSAPKPTTIVYINPQSGQSNNLGFFDNAINPTNVALFPDVGFGAPSDGVVNTNVNLNKILTTGQSLGTNFATLNVGDRVGLFVVMDHDVSGSSLFTSSASELNALGLNYDDDHFFGHYESSRLLAIASSTFSVTAAPPGELEVFIRQGAASIKSLRDYEVGVVYLDGKGRETTVLIDQKSTITNPKDNSINESKLKAKIQHRAPYWAKYYKFFIKEIGPEYNNIVLFKAYPNDNQGAGSDSTVYAWLAFNSADRNKVSKNDYLILKKEHGSNTPVTDLNARFRVLDIVGTPETIEDDLTTSGFTEEFALQGVPIDASAQDISGKFFVKIEADNNYTAYITADQDDTVPTVDGQVKSGACFEVEKPLNLDLDLYYEASQAYPIYLQEDANIFIKPNATITYETTQQHVDAFGNTYSLTLDPYDATVVNVIGAIGIYDGNYSNIPANDAGYFCRVYVNQSPTNNSINAISPSTPVELIINNQDGSTVTAYAFGFDNGDSFYVYPVTHKVNSSDYLCSSITLGWNNCYSFGNGVESDRIRDDFNANTVFPYLANGKSSGFKASLHLPSYREVVNKNDLIFSEIYNDATNTARYNEFLAASNITKKLNSEYGSIQKLYSREGDVLAFCENKVLKILANKDALFNADGNPQLLSSTNVLGQATPYAGDYGISNNPESFTVEEYRIYFADKFRGAVCRLSMQGITAISDAGMTDWFNDNLETASALVGSYDGKKNEYNLTVHNSTNPGYKKEVHTLSWSEDAKGWVSFKSFIQETGLSMGSEYYTFKNGDIYLHHPDQTVVDRNNFYGTQHTSTVNVLFNDFSGSVKLFKAINYEGTQSKEL